MPTPHGALHRAIGDLTVGVIRSTRARDERDREMGLSEILQQVQVSFSGTANPGWGFASVTINFDFPFYYAPGQRDPDFDRPHFFFGSETNGVAIAVSCTVTNWILNADNGAVIGAVVAIGVSAGTNALAYQAVAHLSFQGFSALGEDETEQING